MAFEFSILMGRTTTKLLASIFFGHVFATGTILVIVNQASENILVSEQEAFLGELNAGLLSTYSSDGLSGLEQDIRRRIENGNTKDAVILLVGPDDQIIDGNLEAEPGIALNSKTWTETDLFLKDAKEPVPVGLVETTFDSGARLLTGHILENGRRLHAINQAAMISAFVLAIPASLLIALILVRIINQRLETVTAIADSFRRGDFSSRLDVSQKDGVFDELSDGINAMLDRLELLVSELRMTTDSLAHDLRSPITRLRAAAEEAMAGSSDDKAREALRRISKEADGLFGMLTTALQISRAEAGIGKEQFSETDISQLLVDMTEIYGPLAEERGVELKTESQSSQMFSLHRELISQALGNLIENALKYSKVASEVVLDVSQSEDTVTISVADNGIGIPDHQQQDAIKRFGRLDPARNDNGSGLGLSLVEAIAKLHDGQLSLSDNRPGLKARIILPKI